MSIIRQTSHMLTQLKKSAFESLNFKHISILKFYIMDLQSPNKTEKVRSLHPSVFNPIVIILDSSQHRKHYNRIPDIGMTIILKTIDTCKINITQINAQKKKRLICF